MTNFKITDPKLIKQVVESYPLGHLMIEGGMDDHQLPLIASVPFNVNTSERLDYLCGHLAKNNPIFHSIQSKDEAGLLKSHKVKVLFSGPNGYISPSWYVSELVPTWNYISVEVIGELGWVDQKEALVALLNKSSQVFETQFNQQAPWSFHIPPDHSEVLLNAIVGFKIKVEKIQAVFKLSQNRSEADFQSLMQHLPACDLKNWMHAQYFGIE